MFFKALIVRTKQLFVPMILLTGRAYSPKKGHETCEQLCCSRTDQPAPTVSGHLLYSALERTASTPWCAQQLSIMTQCPLGASHLAL